MKKTYQPIEEKPCLAHEPVASYGMQTEKKTYTIPDDILGQAWEAAIRDVDEGRARSTREVMDMLDKEMGWK
ncbi:MAG: hypothetical protein LBM62_10335 [Mediterranea sp.]|jgi:hypothetical protein|nr:hypothetical protein [Mediterranea sp.]